MNKPSKLIKYTAEIIKKEIPIILDFHGIIPNLKNKILSSSKNLSLPIPISKPLFPTWPSQSNIALINSFTDSLSSLNNNLGTTTFSAFLPYGTSNDLFNNVLIT